MAIRWIEPEHTIDPSGPYTEDCIEAASWLLYKLTAEKYPGRLSTTDCYSLNHNESFTMTPTVVSGNIMNISGNGSRKLYLRQAPVLKINAVSSANVLLPSSAYQLRNNAFIIRTDLTPWNFSPTTEICVSYEFGLNPPKAGRAAALKLANEFILSNTAPSQCTLPERVTSVSRQSVSFSVLDPHSFLKEGKLGIYSVDAFISAANPSNSKKRPRIITPDRPVGERIN